MNTFLLRFLGSQAFTPKLLLIDSSLPSVFIFGYFGLFILFALLGFFRATTTGVQPTFILNQKQVQDDWLTRSSFTTILLPIMALFIFLFNAVAWAVYGLISVVEFLAFLFKSFWWLIQWIWYNFLHPVVFFIVKLIWHYVVVWSWRFFKIAFTRIPEAYCLSTARNGFISMLSISFILLFLFYLSSVLEQPWIAIIMVFAFLFLIVFFAVYTLYNDPNRSFSNFWTGNVISRLAMLIATSIFSVSLIIVLHLFAGTSVQLPLLGISFPITQILVLLFVVTFVAAFVSNTIMPAYFHSNDGEFEIESFLISTGIRLPRFFGAIPFILLGGAIASILTVLVGVLLWWSTNTIKENFCSNAMGRVKTEWNEANAELRNFINSEPMPNQARVFANTKLKRIAVLESRQYSLNLLSENWLSVIQNLRSGIRSTQAIQNNIKTIETTYQKNKNEVSKTIQETEGRIADIKLELQGQPENLKLERRLQMEDERLERIKKSLNQLEVQRIIDLELTNVRVGVIKANNTMWVIGSFFSLIGFALIIAIILTPFWVYRTKVYFDLYSYHHEGKSYLSEQIDFYRERNENQPLLGFFVLLVLIVIWITFRLVSF